MAENLGKRPSKGILKTSSSFDNQEVPSRATKETKWDEMNIIATHHPPEKDYGFMKIDEPKTPYRYEMDELEEDELDSNAVALKLSDNSRPKFYDKESSDEEEETPEEREKRKAFEARRKGHYREWDAVKLARKKLMEEDEDEDEETNETPGKGPDNESSGTQSQCVLPSESEPSSE